MASNRMTVSAPPPVHRYEDLHAVLKTIEDSIVVAIDMENIDHRCKATPFDKLSEVGISFIDMREVRRRLRAGCPTATHREVAKCIETRHFIVRTWKWVTHETCPARWHQSTGKGHVAMPYNGQFADSVVVPNGEAAMDETVKLLASLKTSGRARGEKEDRKVVVMMWDSQLEAKTFANSAKNRMVGLEAYQFWDIQAWNILLHRWRDVLPGGNRGTKPGCASFLSSIGVGRIDLHNAGNDAFAEVFGFLRLLNVTESQYENWTGGLDIAGGSIQIFKSYDHQIQQRNLEKGSRHLKPRKKNNRPGEDGDGYSGGLILESPYL